MLGLSYPFRRAVLVAFCCASLGFASRKDEVTLVMVPRDEDTIKVGLDVASRYPVLLISYKVGANGIISLHGWTGSQWVNIPKADFDSGNFFRTGPNSALLVEQADKPFPQGIVPPAAWCEEVYKIATAETRPLIHLVGQYFGFSFKDWEWFAKRYNEELDAINPEGLNVAWYHKRLDDHLRQRKSVGAGDLQYWVALRYPEPPAVLPPAVPGTNAPAPQAEQPTQGVEPAVDPFTNAVPEAVVLGAADADAALKPAEPPSGPETPAPANP